MLFFFFLGAWKWNQDSNFRHLLFKWQSYNTSNMMSLMVSHLCHWQKSHFRLLGLVVGTFSAASGIKISNNFGLLWIFGNRFIFNYIFIYDTVLCRVFLGKVYPVVSETMIKHRKSLGLQTQWDTKFLYEYQVFNYHYLKFWLSLTLPKAFVLQLKPEVSSHISFVFK